MSFMRPFLPFAHVGGLAFLIAAVNNAVSAGAGFAPVSMVAPEVSLGKMSAVGIAYSSLACNPALVLDFF